MLADTANKTVQISVIPLLIGTTWQIPPYFYSILFIYLLINLRCFVCPVVPDTLTWIKIFSYWPDLSSYTAGHFFDIFFFCLFFSVRNVLGVFLSVCSDSLSCTFRVWIYEMHLSWNVWNHCWLNFKLFSTRFSYWHLCWKVTSES